MNKATHLPVISHINKDGNVGKIEKPIFSMISSSEESLGKVNYRYIMQEAFTKERYELMRSVIEKAEQKDTKEKLYKNLKIIDEGNLYILKSFSFVKSSDKERKKISKYVYYIDKKAIYFHVTNSP